MIVLPFIPEIETIETKPLTEDNVKALVKIWRDSETFRDIEKALLYFRNKKDIEDKRRQYVDSNGNLITLPQLSNSRIPYAYFRNIVSQKASFLLSKPITFTSENDVFIEGVKDFFDSGMRNKLLSLGKYSVAAGVAWSCIYYDELGEMRMRVVRPDEVIPVWRDDEHETLDAVIHFYQRTEFDKDGKTTKVEYLDLYTASVVHKYRMEGNNMTRTGTRDLFKYGEDSYSFGRVPFIPWKFNNDELPLLNLVKELLDANDYIMSEVVDAIRDIPQSLKIVKGYTKAAPAEQGDFIKAMRQSRCVFLDADGTIEQLVDTFDADGVDIVMDRLTKAIYDTAASVNSQETDLGNASGVAIKYRFNSMIIAAQEMALCFEQSVRLLIDFFVQDWNRREGGEVIPLDEDYEMEFNYDLPIDEAEIVGFLMETRGVVSDDTIRAKLPFVDDPELEARKMAEQEGEEEASQDTVDTSGDTVQALDVVDEDDGGLGGSTAVAGGLPGGTRAVAGNADPLTVATGLVEQYMRSNTTKGAESGSGRGRRTNTGSGGRRDSVQGKRSNTKPRRASTHGVPGTMVKTRSVDKNKRTRK